MKDRKTRRMVLTVLGFGAIGVGLNYVLRSVPTSRFDFTELSDPAGFRKLSGSGVSAGAALFAGLDESRSPNPAQSRTPLCEVLRGATTGPDPAIAVFTDVNCPICRQFEPELSAAAASQPIPLPIRYLELPRLAPSSEVGARAALAAGLQGAYDAFHARLMRTRFQPDETYIVALAEGLGLDPEQLLTDMHDPRVDKALNDSAALANRFKVPGTPSAIIGRTLVVGALSRADLERLIDLERSETPVC